MRRFTSLQHAPSETRRILRDRFTRYLPSGPNAASHNPNAATRSDEESLRLLLDLPLDNESDPQLAPVDVACQTPEWVAARLWDRGLARFADSSSALRAWMDRWSQLGQPPLTPSRVWSESAAGAFGDAALALLQSEPGLPGWGEFRAEIVKRQAHAGNLSLSELERHVSPVPATLIDRVLWLERPAIERALFGPSEAQGEVLSIASPLLTEIEEQDNSPAPHSMASLLFTIATARPEFLFVLLFRIRQHPALLADLLLHPPTSALACLLVAQWQPTSGAWDREIRARDDQSTKAIAFADAAAVLGDLLQRGSVPPEEVSSLLAWMYEDPRYDTVTNLGGAGSMLATLRSELLGQSAETLRTIVSGLTMGEERVGLGTAQFAAALDIIDAGELAGEIDPAPLTNAYVHSIAAGRYTVSANKVSSNGAACLFELARIAPTELYQAFLFPIDVKARLAAVGSDENPFTINDNLCRSIRAHIRVLSRAVSAVMEPAPDQLVQALIGAVRTAALSHQEKGRIPAFAPRHETGIAQRQTDRPIAADLGAALTALAGEHREALLGAILETDEPMMLAQLLSFVPHDLRSRIERRIAVLTPSEVGEIRSLTEAQARIEELLTAGLADAAATFMQAEENLKPLGNVPGREMARLRARLRLYLLRSDWTGIGNIEPPPQMTGAERTSAMETIAFYRAIAAIKNPAGDLESAAGSLTELQGRRPDVAAYSINLFAARISLLLRSDLFAQLESKALLRGRQVLSEAERMMRHVRALSDNDSDVFSFNKALLLLALGQPDRVIGLLTPLSATRPSGTVAAYCAVALSRMGRAPEAMSMLDSASQQLGDTDILMAARARIESGRPFAATASTSTDDDSIPQIRAALWGFRQLSHVEQAEVWQTTSFEKFVITNLRLVTASVTALVPMMKDVVIDSCEDDLSAIIRELLTARFHFLGWSVPDQSKGGLTALGNPGERDLLLQKDGATVAVIEAVVCDRPITHEYSRKELTSHFQKLFAYAQCALFFHLTYAYIDNPASILDHLRHTAAHDAPAGFTHRLNEDFVLNDSQPLGFVARYAGELGEVTVVFLVLDMGQQVQRDAAKAAADSNPRKKKTK